ncbi:hypothetical protein MMPV_006701 [Pyropia vietnamensis]
MRSPTTGASLPKGSSSPPSPPTIPSTAAADMVAETMTALAIEAAATKEAMTAEMKMTTTAAAESSQPSPSVPTPLDSPPYALLHLPPPAAAVLVRLGTPPAAAVEAVAVDVDGCGGVTAWAPPSLVAAAAGRSGSGVSVASVPATAVPVSLTSVALPIAESVIVAGDASRVATLFAGGGGVAAGATVGCDPGWPAAVGCPGRGVVYAGVHPPPPLLLPLPPPTAGSPPAPDGGWAAVSRAWAAAIAPPPAAVTVTAVTVRGRPWDGWAAVHPRRTRLVATPPFPPPPALVFSGDGEGVPAAHAATVTRLAAIVAGGARSGCPPVLLTGPWGVGKRAVVTAAAAAARVPLVGVEVGVEGVAGVRAAVAAASSVRGGCLLLVGGVGGGLTDGGGGGAGGGIGRAVAELVAPARYRGDGMVGGAWVVADAMGGPPAFPRSATGEGWVVVVGVADEGGGAGGGGADEGDNEDGGGDDGRPPESVAAPDGTGPGPALHLIALFPLVLSLPSPCVADIAAHLRLLLPGRPAADIAALGRLLPPGTTLPDLSLSLRGLPSCLRTGETVTDLAARLVPPSGAAPSGTAATTTAAAVPLSAVGGAPPGLAALLAAWAVPLDRPDLYPPGAPRRTGVLLYGPPGTGKTLLARALAASTAALFLAVNAAAVLSPYIGEAEAGVRRVFRACRSAAPAVLFLDEVDALAPVRAGGGSGGGGDDGSGVSGRVVSTLLTEMDAATDVFVVAATNRPDLVDPALLVPGRLGERVYVGLPSGADAIAGVLAAAARGVCLGRDVDLRELGGELADRGFSGADLAGLVKAAWTAAAERVVAQASDAGDDGMDGEIETDGAEEDDWWDTGGEGGEGDDNWLWASDVEAAASSSDGVGDSDGNGDGNGDGDGDNGSGVGKGAVTVTMADLRAAAAAATPSLSPEVLAGYDHLRRQYEDNGRAGGGEGSFRAAP